MIVTDQHRDRGFALVAYDTMILQPVADRDELPLAYTGYLDAVERIKGCSVHWEDVAGDEGLAYVDRGSLPDHPVRLSLDHAEETAVHAFTPDQARQRAYELLVLADLADAGTEDQR